MCCSVLQCVLQCVAVCVAAHGILLRVRAFASSVKYVAYESWHTCLRGMAHLCGSHGTTQTSRFALHRAVSARVCALNESCHTRL